MYNNRIKNLIKDIILIDFQIFVPLSNIYPWLLRNRKNAHFTIIFHYYFYQMSNMTKFIFRNFFNWKLHPRIGEMKVFTVFSRKIFPFPMPEISSSLSFWIISLILHDIRLRNVCRGVWHIVYPWRQNCDCPATMKNT